MSFFERDELSEILFEFFQVALAERDADEIQGIQEGALGIISPGVPERLFGNDVELHLPAVFLGKRLEVFQGRFVSRVEDGKTAERTFIAEEGDVEFFGLDR